MISHFDLPTLSFSSGFPFYIFLIVPTTETPFSMHQFCDTCKVTIKGNNTSSKFIVSKNCSRNIVCICPFLLHKFHCLVYQSFYPSKQTLKVVSTLTYENNVATSVKVISTLIQRRFVNVDSLLKLSLETTLILGRL